MASKASDFNRYRFCPAQRAQREPFRAAVVEAHRVMADPRQAAAYTARARREQRNAFRLVLAPTLKASLTLSSDQGGARVKRR